jgi:hypothetical protein
LADRITLLQGWSTRLDLPERADVLISELIGTEPLAENVIEVTVDARKRLLKPDARMVPRGIKLFGLPVTIPRSELDGRALTAETLLSWQSWYGIDFSPLAPVDRDEPGLTFVRPDRMRDWQVLADPILLAEVDFPSVTRLSIDSHAIATATSSGPLDGVAIYFELNLSPTTSFSTHPSQVGADNHWRSPVWTVVPPLALQAGDRFGVRFRYRVAGHRSAVRVEKAGVLGSGTRASHP